jgi:hypothetical protein
MGEVVPMTGRVVSLAQIGRIEEQERWPDSTRRLPRLCTAMQQRR